MADEGKVKGVYSSIRRLSGKEKSISERCFVFCFLLMAFLGWTWHPDFLCAKNTMGFCSASFDTAALWITIVHSLGGTRIFDILGLWVTDISRRAWTLSCVCCFWEYTLLLAKER